MEWIIDDFRFLPRYHYRHALSRHDISSPLSLSCRHGSSSRHVIIDYRLSAPSCYYLLPRRRRQWLPVFIIYNTTIRRLHDYFSRLPLTLFFRLMPSRRWLFITIITILLFYHLLTIWHFCLFPFIVLLRGWGMDWGSDGSDGCRHAAWLFIDWFTIYRDDYLMIDWYHNILPAILLEYPGILEFSINFGILYNFSGIILHRCLGSVDHHDFIIIDSSIFIFRLDFILVRKPGWNENGMDNDLNNLFSGHFMNNF